MPERAFRRELLEQARLSAGMRILDIGCGTGTLLINAFQLEPNTVLYGVDGDRSPLQNPNAWPRSDEVTE
jgi:cyclopropane fatty-acyl-phospholipid synthase-like methyltransferase